MTMEPTDNEPIEISADTDDLDSFTDLFSGKLKETPSQPKEEAQSDDVTPVATEPTDDEDDNTDSDNSENESSEDEQPPKKINKVQKRINEVLAKEREARDRADRLQRELDALTNARNTEDPNPTPTPSSVKGPSPDDINPDGTDKYPLGEFDPNYLRDLNRAIIEEEWSARKAQEAKELSQRQEQEARAAIHQDWVSKLDPFVEQHEDFIEKTLELEDTFSGLDAGYSDYLVQTIKSLDHGPEVLYYFANNLDEAKKFVKMGYGQATLALGEINAMFKGTTKKEVAKISAAPIPPQINKGSKTRVVVRGDEDDLDAVAKLLFKRK